MLIFSVSSVSDIFFSFAISRFFFFKSLDLLKNFIVEGEKNRVDRENVHGWKGLDTCKV